MNQRKQLRRRLERQESKRIGGFATLYSVLIILAVSVLQPTAFSFLTVNGIGFDATLPTAVFLAVYTNEYYGSLFGLLLGVICDLTFDSAFPMMPIFYLASSAFCAILFKNGKRGMFPQKAACLLASLGARLIIRMIIALFSEPDPISYIFECELWSTLYTILISPICMLICAPAGRSVSGRAK